MPYTALQAMIDGFAPQGWLNYHRGRHLGSLPDDPAVGQAVRRRRPVVEAAPKSPAAVAFLALAGRLWAGPSDPNSRALPPERLRLSA